jgi:hypothetical protein
MSNEKQTAVEWLWDEIDSIIPYQNIKTSQLFRDALIKAKEMEKQQIIEAYRSGVEDERYDDECDNIRLNGKYYNETYEAKEM